MQTVRRSAQDTIRSVSGVVMAPPRLVPSVAGRGELAVARGATGTSVVQRAYASSPLRLLTPRNHGHAAWVFTSTLGGGLVGGDHIELNLDVEPDAALLLSTQASTKVYRSSQVARADLYGRVHPRGLLVVLPDPVVCFTGARYEQYQHLELEATGTLVLLDWLSSGRHAAGERWAFHGYRSLLRIQQGGRPVLFDATALRTQDGPVGVRMGRFDVLATVILLGPGVRAVAAALLARAAARPIEPRAALLAAAAPLGDGCLLRFAGTSVEGTGTAIREALAFVPALVGDDPWVRKW